MCRNYYWLYFVNKRYLMEYFVVVSTFHIVGKFTTRTETNWRFNKNFIGIKLCLHSWSKLRVTILWRRSTEFNLHREVLDTRRCKQDTPAAVLLYRTLRVSCHLVLAAHSLLCTQLNTNTNKTSPRFLIFVLSSFLCHSASFSVSNVPESWVTFYRLACFGARLCYFTPSSQPCHVQ